MIDGISSNMESLLQTGKYDAINEVDTTKMGYYDMKYVSDPFTLQDDITGYGMVSKEGELVVKSEYPSIMKEKIVIDNKTGIKEL